MCGIAGIVAWSEEHRIKRESLERMAAAIAHRGPDGQQIWINHEGKITPDNPQVGFAFRRLAVFDLSERAMQPMHTPDGRYTLVFNGAIYNYHELKSEISSLNPGYQWHTTGDSEVLLMSYATWREKCVEHLNGMFAFAVWDRIDKSLFLARDRMGQKPLYVERGRADSSVVHFASEPGALSARKPTADFLTTYLRYGFPAIGERRVVEQTFELQPGQWMRFHPEHGSHARSYWEIARSLPAADKHASAETQRLIKKAVQRQLAGDVPIGVLLSGGIDSSVIAACARMHGPVETFSIGFDDPRYDEREHAKRVAAHLGTTHHEFCIKPDAITDLPCLAATFGEPFADSSALPTHYLARETRKHVKVALGGDGGDELFGGYDRYRAMQLANRIGAPPMKRLVATIAKSWTGGHPKSTFARAARFASSLGMDDADRYDSYMRIFDDSTIAELMGADPGNRNGAKGIFENALQRTGDAVTAALATDRVTYLPEDLLTKVDRCSMMHGLEVRSPFMDHELVQFAAGLTTDQLLKGGPKRMLREAFKDDLPAWVFKRKKMGFAVPIGEWFRGELKPMLRDNLFASDAFGRDHFNMKLVERLVDEHETQRIDHSQRLYALLMLELWWRNQR